MTLSSVGNDRYFVCIACAVRSQSSQLLPLRCGCDWMLLELLTGR